MTTLYTNGAYTDLSPAELNSYSLIRYSADQPSLSVTLGLTNSGSVNLANSLGTVSALVYGFTDNDTIVTGDGNDTVWGNSGSDVLSGGLGDDVLIGDWGVSDRVGNDTLYGGDGNDDLIGGPGANAQYGGNGDDVFSITEAVASIDGIFGGTGIDAVSIRDAFSLYPTPMSFSRLAFAEANSIEYLLLDSPGIAVTGTTGNNLFDLSNLKTLRWSGEAYEQRFEVDLLSGNDTFLGGAGDEHVTVTGAGDRIVLGDGDDTLSVVDGAIVGSIISAGAGYDKLELGSLTQYNLPVKTYSLSVVSAAVAAGFESIDLGIDIQLTATALADVFDFSPFNFNMRSYFSPILLLDGDDSVSGASGDFLADGGTGNDTLSSEAGNDRLWGGEGNDALFGGAGNDTLYGGIGADRLVGGEGGDLYQVDSKLDVIVETGLSGRDAVISALTTYRLPSSIENLYIGRTNGGTAIGNSGANQINDGAGRDKLYGLAGDDTLMSEHGRDTLFGGKGDDTYDVTLNAASTIVELALEGNDTVWTYLAKYTLPAFVENAVAKLYNRGQTITGNELANHFTGNLGRDHFYGLDGDDILDGGGGADTMEGGSGFDVYLVDNTHDQIFDSDGFGVVRSTAETYTLTHSIDRLELLGLAHTGFGNSYANVIIASNNGCALYGSGGDDELRGGTGVDNLSGGSGNDTLSDGGGADYLVGGAGDDLFIVDSLEVRVFENARGGTDTLVITAQHLVIPDNVEILRDDYSGGTVNSAGSEIYGSGWNSFFGPAGNNQITTGIGQDSLFGFGGNNTLTGGLGDDLFGVEFSSFYHPFTRITDFVVGSDKIALYDGHFGSLATETISDLPATAFKVLGKGQVVDADDRFLYRPATGALSYDEDGSGPFAARQFALLENHPALSASDFGLVGWIL